MNNDEGFLPWIKRRIIDHTGDNSFANLGTSGISTEAGRTWTERTLQDHGKEICTGLREQNEFGLCSLQSAIRNMYNLPAQRVVLPTTGASGGIRLLCESLFSRMADGCVLIESPCYEPLAAIPARWGLHVRRVRREPGDSGEAFVRACERATEMKTRAVILSNLHNPTGEWLSDEAFAELVLRVRRKSNDVAIVVDETFRDLGPGRGSTAAGQDSCVITVSSLSKSYGLGDLRCGWVTVDPSRFPGFVSDWALFENIGSKLLEVLGALAIAEIDTLGEAARRQLEQNRSMVANWATQMELEGILSGRCPNDGCLYFPRWNGNLDADNVVAYLEQQFNVLVTPGAFFGSEWNQHVRIGFGGSSEVLTEGLSRLSVGFLKCFKVF